IAVIISCSTSSIVEDQSNSNKTSAIPSSDVDVMRSNPDNVDKLSSKGFVTFFSTSSGLAPGYLETTAPTGGSISGTNCIGKFVNETITSKINKIIVTIVNFGLLIDNLDSFMRLLPCCLYNIFKFNTNFSKLD